MTALTVVSHDAGYVLDMKGADLGALTFAQFDTLCMHGVSGFGCFISDPENPILKKFIEHRAKPDTLALSSAEIPGKSTPEVR